MLDVIFQILSIIGIILLVLLCIVLVLLLLVLFFPITYRLAGNKTEHIVASAKAKWLFGFFRVSYSYPEDSILYVKILWHTLYRKKIPQEEGADDSNTVQEFNKEEKESKHPEQAFVENDLLETMEQETNSTESIELQTENTDQLSQPVTGTDDSSQKNGFFKKIEQLKYTILNIYDKIKEIWENITYYVELLKEENTKALFRHVINRVGKILKNIRPRRMKANIVFGTGSPDTTGYVYGMYGMLSAGLGPEFLVEPDFEQAVLKGELFLAGHITIWVLLINALKVFFDPKLHLFIKKVKARMPQKEK